MSDKRVGLPHEVLNGDVRLRERREKAEKHIMTEKHAPERVTLVMCPARHKLAEVVLRPLRFKPVQVPAREPIVRSWCRLVYPTLMQDPYSERDVVVERRHTPTTIFDRLENPTSHADDPTALVASCACGEQRVFMPELRRLVQRDHPPRKLVWDGVSLLPPKAA